jgi:hypothetical protein
MVLAAFRPSIGKIDTITGAKDGKHSSRTARNVDYLLDRPFIFFDREVESLCD